MTRVIVDVSAWYTISVVVVIVDVVIINLFCQCISIIFATYIHGLVIKNSKKLLKGEWANSSLDRKSIEYVGGIFCEINKLSNSLFDYFSFICKLWKTYVFLWDRLIIVLFYNLSIVTTKFSNNLLNYVCEIHSVVFKLLFDLFLYFLKYTERLVDNKY